MLGAGYRSCPEKLLISCRQQIYPAARGPASHLGWLDEWSLSLHLLPLPSPHLTPLLLAPINHHNVHPVRLRKSSMAVSMRMLSPSDGFRASSNGSVWNGTFMAHPECGRHRPHGKDGPDVLADATAATTVECAQARCHAPEQRNYGNRQALAACQLEVSQGRAQHRRQLLDQIDGPPTAGPAACFTATTTIVAAATTTTSTNWRVA